MYEEEFNKGVAELKSGNIPGAIKIFQDIVKNDNNNEKAWLALSKCTNNIDAKIFRLNKVLDINPNNKYALNELKIHENKKNDNEKNDNKKNFKSTPISKHPQKNNTKNKIKNAAKGINSTIEEINNLKQKQKDSSRNKKMVGFLIFFGGIYVLRLFQVSELFYLLFLLLFMVLIMILAEKSRNDSLYHKNLMEYNYDNLKLDIENYIKSIDNFIVSRYHIDCDDIAFIAADKKNKNILFGGYEQNTRKVIHKIVNTNSILKVEIIEDSEDLSSNSLASAAIGALFFGGVGAVVGAISGSHRNPDVSNLGLKLSLDDIENPYMSICFSNKEIKKDSTEYKNIVKTVQDWYGIISILMQK